MKSVSLTLVFLVCSLIIEGQQADLIRPFSSQIELSANYSELSGLQAEIHYKSRFTDRIYSSLGLATNFSGSYALKVGFDYRLLSDEKWNFTIGAQFVNESIVLKGEPESRRAYQYLEFPLRFNVRISDRISLGAGVGIPIYFDNSLDRTLLNSIRLAIGYRID